MRDDTFGPASAVDDFHRERRRAALRHVLAQLSGREDRLLSYEEVRRRLRAVEGSTGHYEDVPIARIVGSVGRYQDFTRGFLPLESADEGRWVGVKQAMTGLSGTPPVELYRIGDAYFVKDGHHRVSVARQMGSNSVEAYVIPVHTRVPLSPDDDPEALILKSEYAEFLEQTGLDHVRPDADLAVTAPGAYRQLLEHISVHRYLRGIDEDRPVSFDEAVAHWYDQVYLPVVRAVRDADLLHDFPGRTETDLYLWLSEHRGRLQDALGWELPSRQVAQGMAGAPLVPEPERTPWLERMARTAPEERGRQRLADAVLVAFDAAAPQARVLRQAALLAQREGAALFGLGLGEDEGAARRAFDASCAEHGVRGQLAFASGDPVSRILERAAWVDLVVVDFAPPADTRGPRPTRGLRPLLRRCPRPLLAVPGPDTSMRRALLGYDGGARARIALFAAAYGAMAWGLEVVVVSVSEVGRSPGGPLAEARAYLEHFGVEARYVPAEGSVAEALVGTCVSERCDLLLMGSYKYSRWWEDVFGGVLEGVLPRSRVPVLIA